MPMNLPNLLKGKDFWTGPRRLSASASPGRRPGRLPGGHIGDRADLRKAITLCDDCLPKFSSAKAGYVTKRNLPFVRGRCDGCNHYTERGHLLVHHTLANLM